LENNYIPKLPPSDLIEPWEISFLISNLQKSEINSQFSIIVHYVRMHENTGGAGGFHEGVKRGYEKGNDWLWLMDDDVEPLYDGLENMLNYSHISKCINPSKKYINGELFCWGRKYIDISTGRRYSLKRNLFNNSKDFICINYGCFEGMLIHRSIISKIGFPDKRLWTLSFFLYQKYIY
jgi:GT2 family glycosyltransferase